MAHLAMQNRKKKRSRGGRWRRGTRAAEAGGENEFLYKVVVRNLPADMSRATFVEDVLLAYLGPAKEEGGDGKEKDSSKTSAAMEGSEGAKDQPAEGENTAEANADVSSPINSVGDTNSEETLRDDPEENVEKDGKKSIPGIEVFWYRQGGKGLNPSLSLAPSYSWGMLLCRTQAEAKRLHKVLHGLVLEPKVPASGEEKSPLVVALATAQRIPRTLNVRSGRECNLEEVEGYQAFLQMEENLKSGSSDKAKDGAVKTPAQNTTHNEQPSALVVAARARREQALRLQRRQQQQQQQAKKKKKASRDKSGKRLKEKKPKTRAGDKGKSKGKPGKSKGKIKQPSRR